VADAIAEALGGASGILLEPDGIKGDGLVVGRLHDVVDPDRTMVRVAIVGVLDRQGFAGRAADRVVVREVEVGGVLVGHGLAAVDQDL